ncbi:hypothetical protein H1R20_g596, partial [Candolleomyces eurysporus]
MYSNGVSETILGKAIKQFNLPRGEIAVMTKHIFDSVKQSLERLQLDYIDVLQCHRFDHETPIAETMQALHDVVKLGLVRYIGMSSCWAYQFHAMQNYALANNLTPFISMQNLYNLLYREEEREMMPTLKMFGVGCIPWSPLARGYLSRPYESSFPPSDATAAEPSFGSEDKGKTSRQETDKFASFYQTAPKQTIDRVEELAKKKNVPMSQIALAWLLSKEGM